MTQSDDVKISEDRRDALRYALGIGSGVALAAAMATPAAAQAQADNTLDRIRATKVLRIAVLPQAITPDEVTTRFSLNGTAAYRLTDAAWPWWDAAIAAGSVAAQLLMALRKLENWLLWIAVDLASIPLYLAKGLWLFAGLYLIYLVLACWGLWRWSRAEREGVEPAMAAA